MKYSVVLITFVFLGCSRLVYLTKQAPEQVKLMLSGEKNEELLESKIVPEKVKRKLKLIGK